MIKLAKIKDHLEYKGRFWIVFTGDSITSCEWVHPNWREIVEYVLKEELQKEFENWRIPSWGLRCFNFAFDGATTRDILEKVDEIVSIRPDMVIGLMGTNDPVFKIPVLEHIENVIAISERLDHNGTVVVWSSSTPSIDPAKNKQYEHYASALTQVKMRDDFQIVDMYSKYKKFPLDRIFTFKSEENPIENIKRGEPDVTHPNQLGNAYIAQIILKEVFGMDFDAEKYWDTTQKGYKLPEY